MISYNVMSLQAIGPTRKCDCLIFTHERRHLFFRMKITEKRIFFSTKVDFQLSTNQFKSYLVYEYCYPRKEKF